jgi:ABC-type phosphate transport system substrate-binding protein
VQRIFTTIALCLLALGVADANEPASIVVIVNPASGIDKLSRDEVIDIFLGRYRKLPSGRVALPIDLANPSEDRTRFYQLLVNKSPTEISSYWARLVFSGKTSPPFQVPDAQTAVELVQSNPNAIAYVDRAALNPGVKVVLEIKR